MSWIADKSKRFLADAASRFRPGAHEDYRLHQDLFDKCREEFERLAPTFFKLAEFYQAFLLARSSDAEAEKRGRELIIHHIPPAAFGLRTIESRLGSAGLTACVERVAHFQILAMALVEEVNFDTPKINAHQFKELVSNLSSAKERAVRALSGRG